MPARHDILCGALDFLWRPWGSIEIWEDADHRRTCATPGVTTMLISDHPHLFETGGENYHTDFTAWDYERGHESDPWKTRPDPTGSARRRSGRGIMPYDNSRGYFRGEADFPGPAHDGGGGALARRRTPAHHDRFFLFVDEFDPHEPFDTPEPYALDVRRRLGGAAPDLAAVRRAARSRSGVLDERQARQMRAQLRRQADDDRRTGSAACSTRSTRNGLWDDTAVIVCTDHGHYLGEKDIWGKPGVPDLRAARPHPADDRLAGRRAAASMRRADDQRRHLRHAGRRVRRRQPQHRTHGTSLRAADRAARRRRVRDWALAGVWGREVHLDRRARASTPARRRRATRRSRCGRTAGRRCRCRGRPSCACRCPTTAPCSTACRARQVPVIRQPFQPGDLLPFWALRPVQRQPPLRPAQRSGRGREPRRRATRTRLADLLRQALREVEAPDDQFARLGLQ